MGRVTTNQVSLAYTIESAPGTPGTEWFQLEPNSITSFGATITTVARQPISRNRQRRKGTVTDLDSGAETESDITMSSFRDFIQGFVFVEAINGDVVEMAAGGAETTGDTYTGFTAFTAAQAGRLNVDTLLWVTGSGFTANNGLKRIDTNVTTSATAIAVSENLTDETNTALRVNFVGYRIPAASAVTWDWDATTNTATLAVTGIQATLAGLGIIPGTAIHVGSIATSGGAIQNAFQNSAANDMHGWARVLSFPDANSVRFDKVANELQFDDLTDPSTAVDLIFGEFVRNVPVGSSATDAVFREFTYTIEAAYPNLGTGAVGNTDESYRYARGNYASTAAFNLPLTDKAIVTFGFIGLDTDNPTTTRRTGAAAAVAPNKTTAFNTSSDIARLRILRADESGLSTDFKSLTLTLNNNVTPEKVLGQLGAKFVNFGDFFVDIETQLVFTNPLVINAIRDNETVSLDFVLRNDDGAIFFDMPAMTLGGGDQEFPLNESVLINTVAQAHVDPVLNTSIGVTITAVPLPRTLSGT